ncbi:MAG TPA: tetratricopeptide repeat protein [Terriglobales bacterium]|nr:tetratricopeptide repeat protein [Terriglobales bacterium]
MKLFCITAAAVLVVAGMAAAQQQPPAAPPAGQQTSQPAQSTPPAQQPAAQPGAAAPAAAQAEPAKKQPQAKTQEEYKAYQDAGAKTDLAEAESAADAFATKYPQSELKVFLYRRLMYLYQSSNNAQKTIDMAKKVLEIDPNNPEALTTAAMVLSERTRETDLDKDERLAEASQYAGKALQTVDTDLFIPPNADPTQVQGVKDGLRSIAELALGTVEYIKKNYPAAQPHLEKATQLNPKDPVAWLRLAVVLDQQNKYPDAMAAANKAVEVAPPNSPEGDMAKSEQARLQKLTQSTPAAPKQ